MLRYLLFSVFVRTDFAQGFTGTFEANDVAFAPWTFNLQSDGTKLTGAVKQGSSSGADTTTLSTFTAVYDGTVEGQTCSFRVNAPGGGRTIAFRGVLEGDVITFDRQALVQAGAYPGLNGIYGAQGATHFTARKVSSLPAATGTTATRRSAGNPAAELRGLRVVLIGTGTPNVDFTRSGPSVAVVEGSQAYLVDAGPGVIRRAAEASSRTGITALRPSALTYLFLSHLHSDHTLGYPDLIFTPAVVGRGRALEVYGPKGTQEMTMHLLEAWKKDMDVRINGLEHGNPDAYKVNVHEIKPGVVHKDANVTVTAFRVQHASWDEAFGYRFEAGGRSVVISGDTNPGTAVIEACSGCDVLVHEVYCDPPSGQASPYYKIAHTSATELAAIAGKA
ncbi:MAG TPA: MBL fold metallo-hydrolase [Bryobacteraceae bacterium]|nr:MBL fold metallo-hydrolase [Bryobacteraceae bacterium]